MADREKVISTLEEIKTQTAEIGLDCAVVAHRFIDKILALLKEQEAVEPRVIGTNGFGHPVHACGKCGCLITESMNYCHECGKRIEWEGR